MYPYERTKAFYYGPRETWMYLENDDGCDTSKRILAEKSKQDSTDV